MKRSIFLIPSIVISVFFISNCSLEKETSSKKDSEIIEKVEEAKEPEIVIPEYEIIEKEEHLSMKVNRAKGYYFGSILLKDEAISSKNSFLKAAVKIAIEENIGQAYFYTDRICFMMNDGKIKWKDYKMNSCFLGSIDIAKKGQNWKETISISDFKEYSDYWNKKK